MLEFAINHSRCFAGVGSPFFPNQLFFGPALIRMERGQLCNLGSATFLWGAFTEDVRAAGVDMPRDVESPLSAKGRCGTDNIKPQSRRIGKQGYRKRPRGKRKLAGYRKRPRGKRPGSRGLTGKPSDSHADPREGYPEADNIWRRNRELLDYGRHEKEKIGPPNRTVCGRALANGAQTC